MPRHAVDWTAMHAKLPMGRSDAEKTARDALFTQFDVNSNGYLSLAEVDKGCRDVLGLYDVFEAKPVIMRAFQAAKAASSKSNKKKSHTKDFIARTEFRLFLVYLRQYFEIWQMFEQINQSDDHRVSVESFTAAIPAITTKWGVKVADPKAAFLEIDKAGGGMILFDEFADWVLTKHLDLEDDDDFEDMAGGHVSAAKHHDHAGVHSAAGGYPAWMASLPVDDEAKAALVKHTIDEQAFKLLSAEDLKELGLAEGARQALLAEIEARK